MQIQAVRRAPRVVAKPDAIRSSSATRSLKKTKAIANAIKIVGSNGQISLGKAYAGRSVEISKPDENTIIIRTGSFIPDNERWLYEGDNMERLDRAIKSAESRGVRTDNFDELMAMFEQRLAAND